MTAPPSLAGHAEWPALAAAAEARLAAHGDTHRWTAALEALPALEAEACALEDGVIATGPCTERERAALEAALMELHPWRKGPFELFNLTLDTEWRSDWKWARVAGALGDLSGARVLDVGSGNGYFGWRLIGAGAGDVLGIDPSVLFYYQHEAISHYLAPLVSASNRLLPLPFEAFPAVPYDLVLSMGVLYHRKDPLEHLERLYECVAPGGKLLLETLVVKGEQNLHPAETGDGRYARMRNVWVVPTVASTLQWLEAAGFDALEVIDQSTTTAAEQRSTTWMTFESLAEALNPEQPRKTIEGHPAPLRAAILARRPC
ncbi:MAG: tRNA 5-methoxyuridine(34)/uridine 5-oxyacetic acid(34) synthase CmoB [Pseudomonadota bacterium]